MNNIIFKTLLLKGEQGSIVSIEKTDTNVLTDTYTVTYNDGTTTTFEVTNGKSIVDISKTDTDVLVDTYTITYNDGTTTTFEVVNGNGIVSLERVGIEDSTNEYLITYSDGTTQTIEIENEFPKYFKTPQMYGAKGDGVTDDTLAIQSCLDESSFIFFPKGVYRVTDTLKIKGNGVKIIGCRRSIIKNEAEICIQIGDIPPYNTTGASIDDIVIDCGGNSGVIINNNIPNLWLNNIYIYNIGNNCYGMNIDNNRSNKFVLGNIFIHAGALNVSGENSSRQPIDPTLYTTGLIINNSYDSVIETLYCMGTTVGLSVANASQIHINTYHYWDGNDGTGEVIQTQAQWERTRAVLSNSSAYLYIDEFYPDKPYIAVDGGHIITSYTHYICPKISSITDTTTDLVCYLARVNEDFLTQVYGKLDVNYSSDRVPFRGAILNTFEPYRRETLKLEWAYPHVLDENALAVGLCDNFGLEGKRFTLTKNKWNLIGYALGIGATLTIDMVSSNNIVCANFDLFCKSYVARSKNHDMLLGSQTNTLKLGLGNTIASGFANVTWTPVYIYTDTPAIIRVRANGIAPFAFNHGTVPADNITMEKEYTFNQLT